MDARCPKLEITPDLAGTLALFGWDAFDKALLLCKGPDPDQVALGTFLLFTGALVLIHTSRFLLQEFQKDVVREEA